MPAVNELHASSWLTDWRPGSWGTLLVAVVTIGYVAPWIRARRRGRADVSWLAWFLTFGAGALAYTLCGPVEVWSTRLMWVFALQVALLVAVIPTGFALARPVDVIEGATGSTALRRVLGGHLGRALMYPFVSSILAMVSVIVVFFTPYGQAALDSTPMRIVLTVHLLVVGVTVVLPLLAGDLLPAWAGPGVRVLLACVDGLFDAIPGILVMTHHDLLMPHFPGFAASASTYRGDMSASLDQKFAGGALLAVAESVGLPLLAAVFIEWMRADRASALRADAELDAQYGDGPGTTTPWWITAAPATSEGSADATLTASEGDADAASDRTSTPST